MAERLNDLIYLEDVFELIDNNGFLFDDVPDQVEFRCKIADLPRIKKGANNGWLNGTDL